MTESERRDALTWKRLKELNGGESVYHTEPEIDTPDEVWFYNWRYELRIWERGTLMMPASKPLRLAEPVSQRTTLYHLRKGVFIDVEQRGNQLLVRRGFLNGQMIATQHPESDLQALLDHYKALAFKEITPWNASKNQVTRRTYFNSPHHQEVEVDGASFFLGATQEHAAGSREEAIRLAEAHIAKTEAAGFDLYLIELSKANYPNPVPVPKRASKAAAKNLPALPKPTTPFEAVDAAVALLKALHQRLPKDMFIAECLTDDEKEARIDALGEDVSYFQDMHEKRIGGWLKAKPVKPRSKESSWDYFARVYDSLTWIVNGRVSDGMPGFYCGNDAGGGWSCLEIDRNGSYDIDDLVENTGNEDFEQLFVFHGGWHNDASYAFDYRTTSPAGENAIIPFDESMDELPRRTPAARIVPFGNWLYKEVVRQAKILDRNVSDLNP